MGNWTLDELLSGWNLSPGLPPLPVSDLRLNSREVRENDVFIALSGRDHHGLNYANAAEKAGAVAVLYDPEQPLPDMIDNPRKAPVLAVPGLARKLADLASQFYGAPSEDMQMVGVTGTNGKTSCAHFIAQGWERHSGNAGFIGTIGSGLIADLVEAERTTPDAISLQRQLSRLRKLDAELVAMEVSSHALDQGRTENVAFDIGVFTNLSRDHLDYHGDMHSYEAAKRTLFEDYALKFAVINSDDPVGKRWARELSAGTEVLSYALADQKADVRANLLATNQDGLLFDLSTPWGDARVASALLGPFNVQNLLATAAVLGASGVPFPRLVAQLELMQPVPGRMVRLGGEADHPLVVVDYAHSPDALEQVLTSLRSHCEGRLLCVFGCGGDRDQGKRPLMGGIAESLADQVILTNDNPRTEEASDILLGVLEGMDSPLLCHVEPDRAQAIRWAIAGAGPDDLVLIAGKGHENYQEGACGVVPFNDEVEARLALGVAA